MSKFKYPINVKAQISKTFGHLNLDIVWNLEFGNWKFNG